MGKSGDNRINKKFSFSLPVNTKTLQSAQNRSSGSGVTKRGKRGAICAGCERRFPAVKVIKIVVVATAALHGLVRCFVVDLSNYRCILKSCLSFFVMNRKNFKQAFFHQLMCFLSVFNFVVTLNFHVIHHVIMSFDKKS